MIIRNASERLYRGHLKRIVVLCFKMSRGMRNMQYNIGIMLYSNISNFCCVFINGELLFLKRMYECTYTLICYGSKYMHYALLLCLYVQFVDIFRQAVLKNICYVL